MALADRVVAGDPRALARAITLVEDAEAEGAALIRQLFAHTGQAFLIGVTGPPGAGKSTLVDQLVRASRAADHTVGVLAVDPSSPYTGGALLGDRVRMQGHASDPGVFIRSMATRGHLGGLARTTSEAAMVLDAAGRDRIFIETVGVGQDEIDIVRTADVSVVVLVPGTGDDVQALKAGIMEIADIFIVNKSDREGADRAVASVQSMLALQAFETAAWRPPVLKTEATMGQGVAEVMEAIERFRQHQAHRLGERRLQRAEFRLRDLLAERVARAIEDRVLAPGELEDTSTRIARREVDPYTAADAIVARAVAKGESQKATLDHVGIAVADLDRALAFYRDALGLDVIDEVDVQSHDVRAHFLDGDGARLELLEALSPSSPIAKFLAARGPGIHHITLRVDDLRATLARLRDRGVRLVDEEPREGAEGALIAFVHPSSAHGVLVELKESGRVEREWRKKKEGRRKKSVDR